VLLFTDQYVGVLKTAIEGFHRVARDTLKQSQKRMKRDYDVKVRARELKLGDLVYQLDTATVKGKTRKLSPSWKGPGVVIEKLTPYLYKIKLKQGIITANHDRLKLCQDREAGVPRTPEHQFRRQPNFPTQHHHIGCVPCASIYRGP
jgi:hypothetical protein